mgnify:CR=1 FL=1
MEEGPCASIPCGIPVTISRGDGDGVDRMNVTPGDACAASHNRSPALSVLIRGLGLPPSLPSQYTGYPQVPFATCITCEQEKIFAPKASTLLSLQQVENKSSKSMLIC